MFRDGPSILSRLRIWSHGTVSAVPSRVCLLNLHAQAESGVYSRDSSRFPRRRPFIYVNHHTSLLGQSRLSFHAIITHRLVSPLRVRRHRASSPQGSSSNGCCLFAGHHGPISVRLFFPTPTVGMKCIINRRPLHTVTVFYLLLYAAHIIIGSAMVCMYVCLVIIHII